MTVPEHLLWATAVILAVLLLRHTLGRRIPALGRYALWLLVVLRLLVPGRLAVWPARLAEEAAPTPVTQTVQTLPEEGPEQGSAPAQTTAPPETGEPAPVFTLGQVGFALWLTGAAAVGGWFLVGNVRLYRRLRRDRVPCGQPDGSVPVPVYVVADLPGPCLAGLFRPAIYLPPGVADDPAACRHALTHELCHRAHGDHFWALLRGICLTLWWFHPLVWAAAVLSRRDCEVACDEAAVKRLGEGERIPYGRTLVALAAQAARPGGLLLSATSMGAGRQELMERVISMTSPKKISRLAVSLTLALSLLVGTATFTTAAQSGNGYLPRQVQPDPTLTVAALDPTVVTIPDFDWTGGRGSYEAEILIRWMSAYGQQFYALPEGNPWKAGDVWVVPNVFYGKGNGILGGAGEKDGTDLNVVDLTGKNRYAGTWVTLAIKPAGGIQAVEPLFRGGVPRGTGAFADYVLLQYHVQLICEAGDGQWRHEFSCPCWNTRPPGDPAAWTAEQLALWESNLLWERSMNVGETDTAASRQAAGEQWADYYAGALLTIPNNGNPLKADDVRVGSVTLLSQTADTLSFRVELAFRPIWGTEGAMAFCTGQYGADACALGTGELEGYVTLTLPLTMKRDTTQSAFWVWWTGVQPD